jgi:drug/metabolite transporter (DMT)-like permease
MSSYRQDNFDLSGRERPPTRYEWIVASVAILVGLLMLGIAIFGDSGPRWLHDLRQVPMAILMFVLASTYVIRARRNAPDEQYSPRALNWVAALFILIGLLMVVFAVIDFQGAK